MKIALTQETCREIDADAVLNNLTGKGWVEFCDFVIWWLQASIGSRDEPPQKYPSVSVSENLINHSSVLWVFHDVIVCFAIWVGQTTCDGF